MIYRKPGRDKYFPKRLKRRRRLPFGIGGPGMLQRPGGFFSGQIVPRPIILPRGR